MLLRYPSAAPHEPGSADVAALNERGPLSRLIASGLISFGMLPRALGGIKFDRLLMSAATYPTDYGYLRNTLAEDADPLDALICFTEPTFLGA